jgi:hypothetical protein
MLGLGTCHESCGPHVQKGAAWVTGPGFLDHGNGESATPMTGPAASSESR